MNKRKVGTAHEAQAIRFLQNKGYTVLERNFRCKVGEIDLVALDGEYLVFIEVKFRKTSGSGYPEEAVGAAKQRKISRTAEYYCMTRGISPDAGIRFDVIAIDGGQIRCYKNAFPYYGY